MVKFLKPGKVVILLTGRMAGKKAVIVKSSDDGTGSRPYGHAIVVGLSKEPRKVGVRPRSGKAAGIGVGLWGERRQPLQPAGGAGDAQRQGWLASQHTQLSRVQRFGMAVVWRPELHSA